MGRPRKARATAKPPGQTKRLASPQAEAAASKKPKVLSEDPVDEQHPIKQVGKNELPEHIMKSDDQFKDFLNRENYEKMFEGEGAAVFKLQLGQDLILRWGPTSTRRTFDLTKQAGDCSIPVFSYVEAEYAGRGIQPYGIIMELAEPIDFKAVTEPEERAKLKNELIDPVKRLHGLGIVHGDVKPSNFGRRLEDRSLRFIDFVNARGIDEDPKLWKFGATDEYLRPTNNVVQRCRDKLVPGFEEEMYALAMAIYELYAGHPPFDELYTISYPWGEDQPTDFRPPHWESLWAEGKTVDLDEVKNNEVREWIRDIMVKRGAKVKS